MTSGSSAAVIPSRRSLNPRPTKAKKRQASEGGSSGVAKEGAVVAWEEELNPKKKKSKTKDGAKQQQQQPEAAPAGPAATDKKKKASSSAGGDLSMEASVLGAFFGDVDGQDGQDGQDAVVGSGRSIADVYSGLLGGGKPKKEALQNLEFYGYLERCLVPLCASDASRLASVPCVMSVMLMLNEKFQKALPSWDAVTHNAVAAGQSDAEKGIAYLGATTDAAACGQACVAHTSPTGARCC